MSFDEDTDDRHPLPEQRTFCARQIRTIRARARLTDDPSEKERLGREVEALKGNRDKVTASS